MRIKFKPESIESLIESKGQRRAAQAIVDTFITKSFGLSLYDLPDSSELCSIVDDVEGILEGEVSDNWNEAIGEVLATIDREFIEEQIFS